MRPNGTPVSASSEALQGGLRRVTSLTRWLARRKGPAAQPAPKISVVMPVYNAEATLEECLEKLGHSTFEDFEVVVVDDGSTDRSKEIMGRFPIRVIPSPGRVGPAPARNLRAPAAPRQFPSFPASDATAPPATPRAPPHRSPPT